MYRKLLGAVCGACLAAALPAYADSDDGLWARIIKSSTSC